MPNEETIREDLSLPPAFRARTGPPGMNAVETACALAESGADPGTLARAPRDDVADCAIVLAPSEPLAPSLCVAYVAMVAAADALGALIPPVIPVGFGWPDRIVVNGAPVGGIRVLAAETEDTANDGAVPAWMVVGLTIALKLPPADAEPGRAPHRTALEMEGCGDLTVRAILESFARHFLYWMNRWQDDGFAPVRLAWLGRAAGYGVRNRGMETAGPWADRILLDLAEDGSVTFQEDGRERTRSVTGVLGDPTWSI
ncbi:MAG: biotin/lipoate--protein ligase family protein [Gammaproteobacteria bacterium]|jgi:biotin-(acetyl-CoA carboxylase) ligase